MAGRRLPGLQTKASILAAVAGEFANAAPRLFLQHGVHLASTGGTLRTAKRKRSRQCGFVRVTAKSACFGDPRSILAECRCFGWSCSIRARKGLSTASVALASKTPCLYSMISSRRLATTAGRGRSRRRASRRRFLTVAADHGDTDGDGFGVGARPRHLTGALIYLNIRTSNQDFSFLLVCILISLYFYRHSSRG